MFLSLLASPSLFSHFFSSDTQLKTFCNQIIWESNRDDPSNPSTMDLPFLRFVQHLLDHTSIKSVLEVGCRDELLAQQIFWGSRSYVGIDVTKAVIERNQTYHETENIHFLHLDIESSPLPEADLLICKDGLQHLSIKSIHHLLSKFKKFRFYILVNELCINNNQEICFGGPRGLDLTASPFFLRPKELITYVSGEKEKQIIFIENDCDLLDRTISE